MRFIEFQTLTTLLQSDFENTVGKEEKCFVMEFCAVPRMFSIYRNKSHCLSHNLVFVCKFFEDRSFHDFPIRSSVYLFTRRQNF